MIKTVGIYFLLFLFWSIKAFPQDGPSTAHFRSYHASLNAVINTELKFFLAPAAKIMLFNGTLEIGGHYAFQPKKDTYEIRDYEENLMGTNIERRSKWYETNIDFNVFRYFGYGNSIFLFSTSLFNYYGPGSRAILAGFHAGSGGTINKVEGYQEKPMFLLKNSNGDIVPSNNGNNSIYKRQMFTNIITEYVYAGIKLQYTSKGEIFSHLHRGGNMMSFAFDMIVPHRIEIGKMYSSDGRVYTPVPINGDQFSSIGYRAVLESVHSSVFSYTTRLEAGKMSNFGGYFKGLTLTYFKFMLGFNISPKKGYVRFI